MGLVNRASQIPNGLKFYCPVLKWQSPNGASFRVICEGYAQAVRANIAMAKQKGLPITMTEIENAIDAYNTAICVQNGWTRFVQSGAAPVAQNPFSAGRLPLPNLSRSVAASVAGGEVLVEWIASGAEAVPAEQANKRAEICVVCPLNEKGDFSRWFTKPVSEAIRTTLNLRRRMNFSTPSDDKLNICAACLCPLRLKVHLPLAKFFDKMTPESKDALDSKCWILSEASSK